MSDEHNHGDHDHNHPASRAQWIRLVIAGLAALASEAMTWFGQADAWSMGLAFFAMILGGGATLKKGWMACRQLRLNMYFLMSLAVTGAILIGQWSEAAVVICLFTLAEMIEGRSLERARHAIKALMAISPEVATVQKAPDRWDILPAREVPLGAFVRVKPGESVPLDGVVMAGNTTINQAPITGESLPVNKQIGDPVFAGTINVYGEFTFQVNATYDHSCLSRIIQTVTQAQGERAPIQRFVDQFAKLYIPIVVLLAVLVAVIPGLFLDQAFIPWMYKALVLLVIACPCALVISTPVTIVSGLAAAARQGILVKGGRYLEMGRKIGVIALDKTGTLTLGQPTVTDIAIVDMANEDKLDLWQAIATNLASRSDHPISVAIAKQMQGPADVITEFTAIPGRGVKGRIQGKWFYLGNHTLVHDMGICNNALEARLDALESQGKTTALLCTDQAPLLIFALADTLRPTSLVAVDHLQALNVEVIMLTGDNQHTATAIAHQVGITDARGGLLPEDKLAAIQGLSQHHAVVGMVGDGINDAPALARANIGFAMGAAGSDTALETADVALMDDDLRKIPHFIHLSKRTHHILMQNITLALGIKALFLGLAMMGDATLWMAVFADMGASLLVVLNGCRLLRVRA